MPVTIYKNSRNKISLLLAILMIGFGQPAWADGSPASSIFSNPLAVTLIILMLLLLIIIGILGNILLGTADLKLKKRKNISAGPEVKKVVLIALLFSGTSLYAQDTATSATQNAAATIGGMSSFTFYVIAAVIFLELFIILALLVNIKFLISAEKEKAITEPAVLKTPQLSWWDKINKLRPVNQEAELDLGHEYDGIRELNNRLPPWWLYGFYLTIIVAFIYMWRYHVSHTAPLSIQEYENSVQVADMEIKEYLKKKGENMNENSVTLLTDAADIKAGKAIFTDPSRCITCHGPEAGGNSVGPNLTDDYWIYGGNIKDLFKTIKYGTNKGMRSWKDDLSARQIAQVASYVKSLHGTKPANPKPPQGEFYKEDTVPATTVVDSLKEKR